MSLTSRLFAVTVLVILVPMLRPCRAAERPHIVLVMSDDQGWGQTGYYGHPILGTPNLDTMAAHGLRFDRFYAGAPNCSPTRATVLTGRSNDRAGVFNHGHGLRRQERTIAQALQQSGYTTGHFGKWHLNGIRGPGVPIFAEDERHPGHFGFDEWVSVTNFFDMNPAMSRQGAFEKFEGDSSEVIVREALAFMRKHRNAARPLFVVIWYGTPHSPWKASAEDRKAFGDLQPNEQNHYGELVAMDRSVGTLRRGLRDLGLSENTLIWFNSDNGGLKPFGPAAVGNLRGWKGTLYEGGLRVPAIIEWPAVIKNPRITAYPAATLDIFPTLADIAGLPEEAWHQPQDGMSLRPLFTCEIGIRSKAIPFRHTGRGALIDNDFKLVIQDIQKDEISLYNLAEDPGETQDLSLMKPEIARDLARRFGLWNQSVENSIAGEDYEGGLMEPDPAPQRWESMPAYQSFAIRKR